MSTALTHQAETADEFAPVEQPLLRRFGAEILGTFIFTLIGLGVALYAGIGNNPDEGATLLAWAAGVLVAMATIGHVSGGHLNPAVTLAAALTGRISWIDILPYWVAQLIGGLAAASLLFVTVPEQLPTMLQLPSAQGMFSRMASGYGEHSTLGRLSQGQVGIDLTTVLLVEAVAAAVLVAVALAAGRSTRFGSLTTPVAVGLTYGALTVAVDTLTGGAINPVRATVAAVFSDSWALGQLWLFWIAPVLGAAIAGLLFTVFAPRPLTDTELAEFEDEERYEEFAAPDSDGEPELVADAETAEETETDDSGPGEDEQDRIDPAPPTTERDDEFTEDYDASAEERRN